MLHFDSVSWKYFATSHGKEAVDDIGGRAKSLVRTATKSKRNNTPIVQFWAKICDRGYAKNEDFLLWSHATWKLHGIMLNNEQN